MKAEVIPAAKGNTVGRTAALFPLAGRLSAKAKSAVPDCTR